MDIPVEPVEAMLPSLAAGPCRDAAARRGALIAFTAQLQAAANLGGTASDGPCGHACACLGRASEPVAAAVPLIDSGDPTVACTLAPEEAPARAEKWATMLEVGSPEDAAGAVTAAFGATT